MNKTTLFIVISVLSTWGFQIVNADDQGCCSWNAGLDYCQANEMWMCENRQQSPTCSCDFNKNLEYERSFLESLKNKKKNIEKDRHSYLNDLRGETEIKKARITVANTVNFKLTDDGREKLAEAEKGYSSDIDYYESLVRDANRENNSKISLQELKIDLMIKSLDEFINQNEDAIYTVGVDGLRCKEDERLSRDRTRCLRIPNCPKYGYFSREVDACVCEEGYRMTSNELNCLKDMVAPRNGYLTEKGFSCNEGYKRVNQSCVIAPTNNKVKPVSDEAFGEYLRKQLFTEENPIPPTPTPIIIKEEFIPPVIPPIETPPVMKEVPPQIEEPEPKEVEPIVASEDSLEDQEMLTQIVEEEVIIQEPEIHALNMNKQENPSEKKKGWKKVFNWFNSLFK